MRRFCNKFVVYFIVNLLGTLHSMWQTLHYFLLSECLVLSFTSN